MTAPDRDPIWTPDGRPWGLADALALVAWTAAVAAFFWDLVTLQKALFYFDITEINYPYRDFLASELRAGRFSRWHPGLYCGLPLFSESQAGYFHPLKFVFYPWMATWQALNLDTVGSIWLTGLGAYGWLRRHVGASGALTGAAILALGGFTWAHLIHTSMNNALTSVPFAFWALELAWGGNRHRGVAMGGLAIACQVFAGHLQDVILTLGVLGFYATYRAAIEASWRGRISAVGAYAGIAAVGVAVSAVQWIPSKELLDRSPRAGGLSYSDLTYGSWAPELLPTLVVREAYGTRARDTDWMDGYYPYHEMNVYLGVAAIALAVVGAAGYRDRWVAAWVILAGVGATLMLGRYTFLFDYANRIPIAGSSRIPVRFHLWVTIAVAPLAAVGVDRLSRPGRIRLGRAGMVVGALVLASIPIMAYVYSTVWTDPDRWSYPTHLAHFRWLGRELTAAAARTAAIAAAAFALARVAGRSENPTLRRRLAAALPLMVIADLFGSHWRDVPTIDPAYWTDPPASARFLREWTGEVRIFGEAPKSSGEPGYASEPVDFFAVRDTLGWSLPPVWGVRSAIGETPIKARRLIDYFDQAAESGGRFDVESVTHWVTGQSRVGPAANPRRFGAATVYANPSALPRARLMGRPAYAVDVASARAAMRTLRAGVRDRLVVEDPDRPLPSSAAATGSATIVEDLPERISIRTDSPGPAYLVLADTFDPGWSAVVDGRPAPIRPAFVAFRAVYLVPGPHTVDFAYVPAGFRLGSAITGLGLLAAAALLVRPGLASLLGPEHGDAGWPVRWPAWGAGLFATIVLASAVAISPSGISIHPRWKKSVHTFTWGAGLEAMRAQHSGG